MFSVRNNTYWYLAAFFLLTFLVRLDTFFISSFDWDESLYFLGAQALLDGHLPYTEVWDHKPPSIFGLHALSIGVFGSSYLAIRISSCIAIAFSAYFIFCLLNKKTIVSVRLGTISAIFFIISMRLNGGKAANSEIYYLPFVLLAFIFAKFFIEKISHSQTQPRKNWFYILFSGIAIGIAGSINYLALLYTLPLGVYFLFSANQFKELIARGAVLKHTLFLAALGLLGVSLVFTAILLTYAVAGHFDDFIYANFTANEIYIHIENQPFSISQLAKAFINQFSTNWLLWLLAGSYVFFFKEIREQEGSGDNLILALLWMASGLIAVLVSRLYWPHYFLQFNPGLSILAGSTLNVLITTVSTSRSKFTYFTAFLILFGGYYNTFKDLAKSSAEIIKKRHIEGRAYWGDTPRQVASHITNSGIPYDYIYVVDYNPMIYALTGSNLPTKYLFPPFLIGKTSSQMLPLPLAEELGNILKTNPTFIIKKTVRPALDETNDYLYNTIDDILRTKYKLDAQVNEVDIYVRNAEEH